MSIVFMTGNHPRHFFMARALARTGLLTGLVLETREDHIPQPPDGLPERTRSLFVRHFAERAEAETRFFGAPMEASRLFPGIEILETSWENLNSQLVWTFLQRLKPALLLSYGVHKLTSETLARVDGHCWNIHGGLSPWYRGTITHFWPSYLLEPQMTGMTVHRTEDALDGGHVIHQTAAPLIRGDGLHDLACRAVSGLAEELPRLVSLSLTGKLGEPQPQKTSGRLWRSADWRPCHLHLIYEQHQNRIVDRFLDGDFGGASARLVRQF